MRCIYPAYFVHDDPNLESLRFADLLNKVQRHAHVKSCCGCDGEGCRTSRYTLLLTLTPAPAVATQGATPKAKHPATAYGTSCAPMNASETNEDTHCNKSDVFNRQSQ